MNMNGRRFAFSTLAAFAVIFIFEWLFHGIIMRPSYQATAALWRPEEAMQGLSAFSLMRQLFLATILSWIFIQHYEARGAAEGMRYGLYVGLLMGVLQFGSYAYMPIPLSMALSWLAGGTLMGVLVGFVLALVYEEKALA